MAVELLGDKGKREEMGRAGTKLCEAHRGATLKHLEVLKAAIVTARRD
jgi:hypothetical protein